MQRVLEERRLAFLIDAVSDELKDPAGDEECNVEPERQEPPNPIEDRGDDEHDRAEAPVENQIDDFGDRDQQDRRVDRACNRHASQHAEKAEHDQRDADAVECLIAAGPVIGSVVGEERADVAHGRHFTAVIGFAVQIPKGVFLMRKLILLITCLLASAAFAQTNNTKDPTWWDKYQYILNNGSLPAAGNTTSVSVGGNVDVSNECGPQSETYITINTKNPTNLAGGSNEIFRLPMRGYWSTDGGQTWGGIDLPLPPPKGNGIDFGSDPTLAFDTRDN